MGVFSSIMSKIFNRGDASGGADQAPSEQVASAATMAPLAPGSTNAAASSTPSSQGPVDVEAVLSGMSAQAGQKLDWRHSIVDLMKLLNLDSSLSARKQLAQELNYTGDTNDSATMNVWLHKQVMQKLAENGGKVPDELKA